MRILYVEDNETNQALVGRVVRAKKHDVIFRDEGEGALDVLAADSTIDLVLLDIELAGGISGIDVVKTLRTRGDKRPVVAVTAYAMMGDRERILDAGCDQYLPKPLVIVDLMALMDHYEAEVAEKQAAPTPVATPAAVPVEQAVDAAVPPAVVPPAVAPADTPVPVLQSEPAPVAESVPASQPDPVGIMPAPQPAADTAAPVPVPVPTPATAPAPADTPQATIEPAPAVAPGPAVEAAMPTVVVSVPNSGDNAQ